MRVLITGMGGEIGTRVGRLLEDVQGRPGDLAGIHRFDQRGLVLLAERAFEFVNHLERPEQLAAAALQQLFSRVTVFPLHVTVLNINYLGNIFCRCFIKFGTESFKI